MTEAADRQTAIWTYAGRRISRGKIFHVWVGHDGVERSYTKPLAKHASPGQQFEVSFAVEDENTIVYGTPVYHGPADQDDPRLTGWRSLDIAAGVMVEGERRQKKDAEDDRLQDALDVLREHYLAARTWGRRAALIAYVTDQMTLPPRSKS